MLALLILLLRCLFPVADIVAVHLLYLWFGLQEKIYNKIIMVIILLDTWLYDFSLCT